MRTEKFVIESLVQSVFNHTDLLAIPIEIVNMVQYYGFHVYELPMERNKLGMLLVDEKPIKGFDNNKIIVLNKNIPNGDRKRFLIAHMFGHYVLDGYPQKEYCINEECATDNDRENDANDFAVRLLMPAKDIAMYVHDMYEFSNKEVNPFTLIPYIAYRFNVPDSKAEYRLYELKVIDLIHDYNLIRTAK